VDLHAAIRLDFVVVVRDFSQLYVIWICEIGDRLVTEKSYHSVGACKESGEVLDVLLYYDYQLLFGSQTSYSMLDILEVDTPLQLS
jgi:hypothetical protein